MMVSLGTRGFKPIQFKTRQVKFQGHANPNHDHPSQVRSRKEMFHLLRILMSPFPDFCYHKSGGDAHVGKGVRCGRDRGRNLGLAALGEEKAEKSHSLVFITPRERKTFPFLFPNRVCLSFWPPSTELLPQLAYL